MTPSNTGSFLMRFELQTIHRPSWNEAEYETAVQIDKTSFTGVETTWRSSGGLIIEAVEWSMFTSSTYLDPDDDHLDKNGQPRMFELYCSFPPRKSESLFARMNLPFPEITLSGEEVDMCIADDARSSFADASSMRSHPDATEVVRAWFKPVQLSPLLAAALVKEALSVEKGGQQVAWIEVTAQDHAAIRAMERKVEVVATYNMHARINNLFAYAEAFAPWPHSVPAPSLAAWCSSPV